MHQQNPHHSGGVFKSLSNIYNETFSANSRKHLTIFVKKFRHKFTAQKMKFSIKDFFGKCDEICRKLRIWSHLLKKSLMENFIFCVVCLTESYMHRWQYLKMSYKQFVLQSDTCYFSSSDWSTLDFLLTDMANVL